MKVLKSRIAENKNISGKIYRLVAEFKSEIKPGQFFMLKTLDNSFLLPRPISVNDKDENTLTFLYRVEGKGTSAISSMREGEEIQLFGPLGNGFDVSALNGRIAVIGGGIGVAPLLYLAKILNKSCDVYLGFKDSTLLADEFEKYAGQTKIATEDGSTGLKGFITDFVDYEKYDAVVTCGPEIMMNKIAASCAEKNIRCYMSLERRMACGMGVCLGCTVETTEGNKRACKDGPVFPSEVLVRSVGL
jgi:dihydroorotate dehydrogenase electron transfer subunit